MTILDSAEWLRQMRNYSGSGDLLDEANSHDAQFGSTSGADTNDPLDKAFGGEQYLFLPGTANNEATVPDADELDGYTGTMSLRARVALVDWTPGNKSQMIAKRDGGGTSLSYQWAIDTDGTLVIDWFDAGLVLRAASSTVGTGVTDGATEWVRVDIDFDNDASGTDITFFLGGSGATPSWTQLGSVVVIGAVTSLVARSSSVHLGNYQSTTEMLAGDIFEAQCFGEGTLELDINFDDATEPYATFTERSANAATVTINRSASGLVSTVIDRGWALLTTDDFFEIPDDAGLDFAAGDSGTWMVMFRTNTVAAGSDVLMSKKDDLTTSAGYALVRNAATGQGIIADGTLDDDDTVATIAVHTLHTLAMVRNTTDDDIEVFLDGVGSGSATTDSTTVTLANALVQRLGATSGATPANFFEGVIGADAGWRQALTDTEVLEAHLLLAAFPAFPPFARRQSRLIRM